MFVILTPDVKFTNLLQAALAQIDPKSTKNIDDFFVFFLLLESVHIKAAHKHV